MMEFVHHRAEKVVVDGEKCWIQAYFPSMFSRICFLRGLKNKRLFDKGLKSFEGDIQNVTQN